MSNSLNDYFCLQMQNHPLKDDFNNQYDKLFELRKRFQIKFGHLFVGNLFENMLTYCFGLPISCQNEKIWIYNKIAFSLNTDDSIIHLWTVYAHNSFDKFGNEWFDAFKQFIDFIEEKVNRIQ